MVAVKREASDAETIHFVYVVGADTWFDRCLTLRDLLINDDDQTITDIRTTPVMSVKSVWMIKPKFNRRSEL